jgi:hypothetical protein
LAILVPTREELDALLRRRDGDLREEPYRHLLLAMATLEKSGVLTLRRGPLEKEVVFERGAAVECHSNIATETLGRFLVSSGRISEAQYREALSVAASQGVALEEILVERGVIAAPELARAAQQSLGRKLLEPFHWTAGSWHLSSDLPRLDVLHRVRVPQLIVTGVQKVEPYETIARTLDEVATLSLAISTTAVVSADELRLSDEHQRIVGRLRDGATLAELRGPAGATEDLDRFVFALLFLGIAVRRESVAAAPFFELDLVEETPVAPRPQPAPVASAPPQAPVLTPIASAEELAAASALKDPFTLLGLETSAGAVEITRAFIRMAERFLPARYPERDREKAQEVFLLGTRAFHELADPTRRQALIDRRAPQQKKEVAADATRPTPPPARPGQTRRTIIDPEDLYRQGRAAIAAGKLRDALGYFEMAADCDVQNGTYAAEAANCRYQLMLSPATVTIQALKNAIRIDPRCGIAHLYLGKIQEALGNHMEAQAYLGRASVLMNQRPRF